MNRFLYCATDVNGQTIEGELLAQNFAEALAVLQGKNLSIQHIAQAPQSPEQTDRNLRQAIDDPSSCPLSREQALVNARSWAGPPGDPIRYAGVRENRGAGLRCH